MIDTASSLRGVLGKASARQAPPKTFAQTFKGNPSKMALSNANGTLRYLGRGYEGGKLTHYRGWREDLQPHLKRAQAIADGAQETKKGFQYLGSVPRIVIHDWLMKQGKTWEQYATDDDLKKAFLRFYQTEYKVFMSRSKNERSLGINRSIGGRTGAAPAAPVGPSLGASILSDYRKENAA